MQDNQRACKDEPRDNSSRYVRTILRSLEGEGMKIYIHGSSKEIREMCPDMHKLFQTTIRLFGKDREFVPQLVNIQEGDDYTFRSSMVLQELVQVKTPQEIKAEEAVKAAEESLKKAREALEAVKK